MSDIAIKVENLSKCYMVGHNTSQANRHTALRDVIAHNARNFARKTRDMLAGRPIVQGDEVEEFWALQNINFEIQRGEVVGVIGRNGAGKSTLLKILSRITEPTSGRVTLNGRLASLLEVGTGFHPELSGRENIFLNGAILGMTRKEVARKFEEIVDFAEIERFIDTPVKRYSSGMYVRLAFAVAAHLDADMLLIDEVLAVGDIRFQEKCLGSMRSVSQSGRTVIFVSHNLGAVRELCERAIVLDGGEVVFSGVTENAVDVYFQGGYGQAITGFSGPLADQFEIDSIEINDEEISGKHIVYPSQKLKIVVKGRCKMTAADIMFILRLSSQGILVATLLDDLEYHEVSPGSFECCYVIDERALRPGDYTIGFGGGRSLDSEWFCSDNLCLIHIVEEWSPNYRKESRGIVNLSYVSEYISHEKISP